MQTPARCLRAQEEDRAAVRFDMTAKDRERHARILASAAHLMVLNGRHAITLGNFAIALRMSPATIRRLFADLDCLLAEILHAHLVAISRALGDIPEDAPDPRAARRAAYLKFTRGAFGMFTEHHLLLVRDRAALPPDLLEPVEAMRLSIGLMLDNDHPAMALGLLDVPDIGIDQVEAAVAAMPRGPVVVPDFTPEQKALWEPEPKPEPWHILQPIRAMYETDRARAAADAGATAAAHDARAGEVAAEAGLLAGILALPRARAGPAAAA